MQSVDRVSAQCVEVVDDDDSYRTSLIRVLNASGYATTGYRCAGEFLLAERPSCTSCIVLDLYMPGPNGLELLDALALRQSSPPVIFLTGSGDVPASVHAIRSGAVDFLTKPVEREHLLKAVDTALALDRGRRATRSQLDEIRVHYTALSDFEREVFLGVVNGQLNKQLAVTLGICERSIKSYRSRVMKKMRVQSLAGLVRAARLMDVEQIPAYAPQPRLRRSASVSQTSA
jgi:FixJ family two-component response regulator